MPHRREAYMSYPFKVPGALSSSSLQGMERPVRSFKSLIRTVPPHLTSKQKKPLPPTPPPKEAPTPRSSTSSQPDFRERTSSTGSWRAPADWFNSTTPPRRASDSSLIPPARTYSPMIPEPSPDMNDPQMEPLSWQLISGASHLNRLQPIDERLSEKSDLSKIRPTESPLRSPSKPLLVANMEPDERIAPLNLQDMTNAPIEKESDPISQSVPALCLQPASPSVASQNSLAIQSTMEKAFASLGLNLQDQEITVANSYHGNHSSSKISLPTNRQNVRGKKLFDVNRVDPLDDDIWEDVDMDDKARKLSFSQDYHDLLADQYHNMNVKPEVTRNDSFDSQTGSQLKPIPQSMKKDTALQAPELTEAFEPSMARSSSSSWRGGGSIKKGRKRRRINLWVHHRRNHEPNETNSTREAENSPPGNIKSMQSKKTFDLEVDNGPKHDLNLSKLLHSSMSLRSDKKQNKEDNASPIRTTQVNISDTQHAAPIMRLPDDQALAKHLEVPNRWEASCSTKQPYFSPYSESPIAAIDPPPILSEMASQSKFHVSDVPSLAHPLAQELPRSSPTPPPPKRPSFSKSPPLTREVWRPRGNTEDEELRKPRFLDRAREARRKHHRDSRHEKLKRSIKVLGPTDPSGIAGFIR